MCDSIVVPFGEKICTGCLDKVKIISPPWCMRCGKKLVEEAALCSDCQKENHLFARGRSLYEYSSVALSVYRFKYAARREYADFYGEQITEYLGDFIKRVRPDAFIPIPLHRARKLMRGYNQAADLARAISHYTGIPTIENILIRVRNTGAMKRLSRETRRDNLKNAFIIKRNSVKLETIIIIDDIYTTGATIDEAARVFREAGVTNVYFITLAGGSSV